MVSCDGLAQEIVILAGELKIVIFPNEIKIYFGKWGVRIRKIRHL